MEEPKRIVLVIEDGEFTVHGLPEGWILEAHDYDWGEQVVNGYVERDEDVPEGKVEWERDAAFVRYDVPEPRECSAREIAAALRERFPAEAVDVWNLLHAGVDRAVVILEADPTGSPASYFMIVHEPPAWLVFYYDDSEGLTEDPLAIDARDVNASGSLDSRLDLAGFLHELAGKPVAEWPWVES